MIALPDKALIELTQVPLFCGLSQSELARVQSVLRTRNFPANVNIIGMEQPGEVVYIIKSGTVKVTVEQTDGNEVILAFLRAGGVVGEMSVIEQRERSANVVTTENTSVYWVSRANFDELLKTIPMLNFNLTQLLSRRLRLANEQLQALSCLDVNGRVARLLLLLAREYGEPVQGNTDKGVRLPFRLTQSELGSLVGATRVRVNQVLVDYKQRNFISVDSSYRITIHNPNGLVRRYDPVHA